MPHLHNLSFVLELALFAGMTSAANTRNDTRQHNASLPVSGTSYWQTQNTGIQGTTLFVL